MTAMPVTLERVIEELRSEGRISEERAGAATALMEEMRNRQVWYVRTMLGLGAWVASWLIVGFVAAMVLSLGGSTVLGLALLVGAALARRSLRGDFIEQAALATSLAGQALTGFGLAELSGGEEVEVWSVIAIGMSTLLFFAYPDRIHRVLMVLFAVSAGVTLLYWLRIQSILPLIGPLLAALLVASERRRATFAAKGAGALLRPLQTGLMLAAFGCLMLSTLYVLPGSGRDFTFYPRPWLSTLALAPLLLYVGHQSASPVLGTSASRVSLHGLMLLGCAAAWAAPGMLLAWVVALLGVASGHRSFVVSGIAFLPVFIGAYFYGIEVPMWTKALVLVASGALLLMADRLLMRVLAATEGERA